MSAEMSETQRFADLARQIELYGSIEFALDKHYRKLADAYFRLCNVKPKQLSMVEVEEAIGEMRLASGDMLKFLETTLASRNLTASQYLNLDNRTLPQMTNLWLNVQQMHHHLLKSLLVDINTNSTPEDVAKLEDHKLRILTAMCGMLKNLHAITLEVKPEWFDVEHVYIQRI